MFCLGLCYGLSKGLDTIKPLDLFLASQLQPPIFLVENTTIFTRIPIIKLVPPYFRYNREWILIYPPNNPPFPFFFVQPKSFGHKNKIFVGNPIFVVAVSTKPIVCKVLRAVLSVQVQITSKSKQSSTAGTKKDEIG